MNIESYKNLVIAQYEAAFSTFDSILKQVPQNVWTGNIASKGFDQSAFHALFYTDVYLSQNEHVVREQEFHIQHTDVFEGYEEFTFDPPIKRYTLDFVKEYLSFCLDKSRSSVEAETEESLAGEAEFSWQSISRGELHVYNIRHIQHHAAQLILRIRLESEIDIKWYFSGWEPLELTN